MDHAIACDEKARVPPLQSLDDFLSRPCDRALFKLRLKQHT